MASIIKEVVVRAPAAKVWERVRDFGGLTGLAPGFVTHCELVEGARMVTFFNGMTIKEAFVARDNARRRIAYSATGGRASHHNASAQIFEEGPEAARFVWITDVLPDALAAYIEPMMVQGGAAMKAALERHQPAQKSSSGSPT